MPEASVVYRWPALSGFPSRTVNLPSRDANTLRRRRPRPGDKWHLDEVFIPINKERHYLWRAIDQDGVELDILVQRRRNKQAAKKFFRKLLKGCQYVRSEERRVGKERRSRR